MKYPSKTQILALVALVAIFLPGWGRASASDLFSTVPSGDPAYSQLAQLEQVGLLPKADSSKILTRFEMAQKIAQARDKYNEIVVAQADDIPPPPPDSGMTPSSPAAPPAASTAPAAPSVPAEPPAPAPAAPPAVVPAAPETTSALPSAADLAKAEQNLHSLEEAYQFELKTVKDELKQREDRAAAVDASQYEILQKLNGFIEYPSIAIHGLGRAFALSQQYYGDYSGINFPNPSLRSTTGYLDLIPTGSIDKHVRWDAVWRMSTNMEPDISTDFMVFRRITMNLSTEWFYADVGDFEESYTPLTLWNRNNLDLKYVPDMIGRLDQQAKYESFFDQEPNWPFRGLRIGTALAWPDSSVLDNFKISLFANMIANGFQVDAKNASFFGPTTFTDWIFAGHTSLESKKWYVSNISVQLKVAAQGVVLDEPLNTNDPSAIYNQFDPTTWAHQYLVGSWTPEMRIGFGGDFYLGTSMDLAFSSYQDDKLDNAKILSDYAVYGGPYLEWAGSRLSFNFLDVGPNYFSPLAQSRQDGVFAIPSSYSFSSSPDLFQAPLRSQYFMTNIPRAGGIFSFYDRTQDNTFPYGMATPNREGFGMDLDVKTLEKNALKIKGAAYFVKEISGNFVADANQTGVTALDATATVPVPMRTFTYVNIGPSLNIGPLIGWDRDLELGFNARFENTQSDLGTLNSYWMLGGIKIGVFPALDFTTAYSWKHAVGSDSGYGGTTWARYAYMYDNTDLVFPSPGYSVFAVDSEEKSLMLSTAFHASPNSTFYVDYSLTSGTGDPDNVMSGTLDKQFMELTYEIQF